ncbi:hypothetical protein EYF80_061034 [Liparis tanakae]|uniref:Uncharacterized protein n=1 Tax=Liparis tanakae TaxID=230148 RepID=A0A4Z2EIN9_9TELE|nr:hypothetical protein EYF80_061034 [Liparis tanakae]
MMLRPEAPLETGGSPPPSEQLCGCGGRGEAFDERVQRLAPAKRPAANAVRRSRLTFSCFEAAPDPPESSLRVRGPNVHPQVCLDAAKEEEETSVWMCDSSGWSRLSNVLSDVKVRPADPSLPRHRRRASLLKSGRGAGGEISINSQTDHTLQFARGPETRRGTRKDTEYILEDFAGPDGEEEEEGRARKEGEK